MMQPRIQDSGEDPRLAALRNVVVSSATIQQPKVFDELRNIAKPAPTVEQQKKSPEITKLQQIQKQIDELPEIKPAKREPQLDPVILGHLVHKQVPYSLFKQPPTVKDSIAELKRRLRLK